MGEAVKQPLISVIVPIYKVELYLSECIDSILSQTYRNLEIILVDDGSPDTCPEICDAYAEKDSRIIVIHKENGGLSDARNAGLAVCSGEYLVFVDSDDLLTGNAVEALYTLAKDHDVPLVIGVNQRFCESSEPVNQPLSAQVRRLSKMEAIEDMLRNGCASWGRIYHRSVHEEILFPRGEINEDEAIVLRILERCETIIWTDQVVYRYRCRPESITTAEFSRKKMDWYRHCKANLEWIQKHYPELIEAAAERYRGALLWSLTEIALSDQSFKHEVKILRSELYAEKELFLHIPYRYHTDRIRTLLLMYMPFSWYRMFIRLKRNIRGRQK